MVSSEYRLKVAYFGCGNVYRSYKNELGYFAKAVCIIDNNTEIRSKLIDGLRIYAPEDVFELDIDAVLITSDMFETMKTQLLDLGYPEEKILFYRDILGENPLEQDYFEDKNKDQKNAKGKCLIIANGLGCHGVSVVCEQVAEILLKEGYEAVIAAPKEKSDISYVEYLNTKGINVVLQKYLGYASVENLRWTQKYDYVLVNSIHMFRCAFNISSMRNVFMWLHDSAESYEIMKPWKQYLSKKIQFSQTLKLLAVSSLAAENFRKFFMTDINIELLSVGIKDWTNGHVDSGGFCYVVTGHIRHLKGQDIFIKAIQTLPEKNINDSIFLLIGKKNQEEFGKKVLEASSAIENVIFLGARKREEVMRILSWVNVVVVPSREETLSIAAIEGLMLGKVCIVSDRCGIADYIEHGKNGFIFRSEDSDMLGRIMQRCYENPGMCQQIGKNARKTYERYFTDKVFATNIRKMVFETTNE